MMVARFNDIALYLLPRLRLAPGALLLPENPLTEFPRRTSHPDRSVRRMPETGEIGPAGAAVTRLSKACPKDWRGCLHLFSSHLIGCGVRVPWWAIRVWSSVE